MAEVRFNRLQVIRNHLKHHVSPHNSKTISAASTSTTSGLQSSLHSALQKLGVNDVELEPPPPGLEEEYSIILSPSAVQFIADLTRQFNNQVDLMLKLRIKKKMELDISGKLPNFPHNPEVREGNWTVAPVPKRILNRKLDLGDVSPSNTEKFITALQCDVNGIQTDFDDGHCPTWRNQLRGLHNVYKAVFSQIPDVPDISKVPVLMLRPRAWNMIEHNMIVDGKEVPGPLFDFGLLMYHCATHLVAKESGPFFYLSKLEGANEARLWNDIFCWTQEKLGIPHGTIKACVLIENILASFEMEEILYELKEHSLGLNCGIWDYSASFVNKFGHRKDFVLPDRNKYVNMKRHFLKSYMDLVIHTCHKRGAHATGGMVATIILSRDLKIITKVVEAKLQESISGADGFMVYDTNLVPVVKKLQYHDTDNQIKTQLRNDVRVHMGDLLQVPSGGVTLMGLKHNVAVGILFIDAWLQGKGHYIYKGAVEDSATAEISRSQVWQWIRHREKLEDNGDVITRSLVQKFIKEFVDAIIISGDPIPFESEKEKERLRTAAEIFEEVVMKRDFPEFLTTYLNLDHTFLFYQKMHEE